MKTPDAITVTESIWSQFHKQLHWFIQNRTQEPDSVDDILQDVFLKIHSRIHTLKSNSKLQSWIYQITRNVIIDYYRLHKPMEELPEELREPKKNEIDTARSEIGNHCLTPLIYELAEPYRQALLLSDIEGIKQKEIALKEGVSLSGAKSRVQRGRVLLKDMLLKCCQFEFDHQGKMIDYEKIGSACVKCGSGCD